MDAPEIGTRWRLTRMVERFPHFTAPAGAVGVITRSEAFSIALKLDDHLDGAEEWDNEVCWDDAWEGAGSLLPEFAADCEPVR
jgi:hypothetical protein